MARLNNYDIHSSAVGLYGWGLSLDLTGKGYEVSKRTWDTYEHALAYVDNPDDSAVPGNILTVVGDTDEKNGVYLVKQAKGCKLGLANTGDQYKSIVKDATITESILVKLGDTNDLKALQTALNDLETIVTEHTNNISNINTKIDNINDSITSINTALDAKVDKTTTIAGLDLTDNITAEELKDKLGVSDLDYVKDVKIDGKLIAKAEDKSVNITLADLGLTNALHFVGVVEALPETGKDGDVVLFGTKEYVYSAGKWVELGDEGSHALKTVKAIAGEGLTGGGNLSADFTFSLDEKTVDAKTGSEVILTDATATNVITGVTTDKFGRVAQVVTTPVKLQETVVSSLSNDYVNVETNTADGKKEIEITVAVGDVSDATPTGLADAANVKAYVDQQIGAVSGEIPTVTVTGSELVNVTENKSGVATDYTVSVKTQAIASATQGEADGLAKALDVKTYVEAEINALEAAIDYTTVAAADGGYVSVTGENRKYTVGVNTAAINTVEAAGKVADAKDVKDYVDTAIAGIKQATVSVEEPYLSVTHTGDDYKVKANVASSIAVATARGMVADAYDVKQALTWTEL